MICFSDIWHKYHLWFQNCLKFHLPNIGSWTILKHHLWHLCQISLQIILNGREEGGSLSWKGELHNFSFQQTVILFQLNLFNIEKQKQTLLYTIFYINVKWNICGEMSCLLKQWLVLKCTKDALHLRQCTGMYVYKIHIDYLIILINNMQIVTFLFCIPTI